ncbi:hypothetical protein CRYUN_Cryun29cG0034300 [Craigia yunnanensis]
MYDDMDMELSSYFSSEVILPLAHTIEHEEFLEAIKFEGIAHSPEDAIMPRDIFLLQGMRLFWFVITACFYVTVFEQRDTSILLKPSALSKTYLKLPWRPLISIDGSTFYEFDEKFTIVRHAESWNVSALEAIGQIFTPSFGRLYY